MKFNRKVLAAQPVASEIQEDHSEAILFTPSAILDLLSKIDELQEYELGLTESLDGALQLQIGDSFYELNADEIATDIEIDDQIVDQIAAINELAYEDLVNDGLTEESSEPIQSGLIKEIVRTLLIGGVVRMGKQYLTH